MGESSTGGGDSSDVSVLGLTASPTEGAPRPSDTAHSGVPLRAPGRTETPELAIQNNTINKIRGEGSHLTGFGCLTPSPRLSTNQQSARLTTGTC
ncbi:MAG: hypothetical protein ACI8RZ_005934 [Myxococcota bacterium]|jgi:hypothetical protein